MKTLTLFGILLFSSALLGMPEAAAGQECETPEGCRNDPDTQVCTDPEHSETIVPWEDCYVYEGFCQLSEMCGGGFVYADFAADRRITVAGTYVPLSTPEAVFVSTSMVSCNGLVITADDRGPPPDMVWLEPLDGVQPQG